MELADVIAPPPLPLQAVLLVERPIIEQNLNFITTNILWDRGGITILSCVQSYIFCEGLWRRLLGTRYSYNPYAQSSKAINVKTY